MTRTNIDEFDYELGQRLRMLRMMRGLSQHQLGQPIGISFQQIQKYEKGTNRISVSRLFQIANVLKLSPIEIFSTHSAYHVIHKSADKTLPTDWPTREHLSLMYTYHAIPEPRSRRLIMEVMKLLAGH